jgi:hypothetical protein
MAQQQMMRQDASLGDLFADLAEKTGTLIKQEAALVQTELTAKAVFAALIAGLAALNIPVWVSALIVGVVLAIASYVLINSALTALRKTQWAPKESIESIKEDAQWLKNQVD